MFQNSYCLGESGQKINTLSIEPNKIEENSADEKHNLDKQNDASSSEESVEVKSERKKKRKNKKDRKKEKRDKLKDALKAEEENQKNADKLLSIDERKRPYNSMVEIKKPTEEEIEAYYLKRRREEDPMSQFL